MAGSQNRRRSHDGKTGPAPIGEPGSWVVAWPPFVGFTLPGGRHFHAGFRWDDVDGYYSLSAMTRKYPKGNEGERDTSTK